MKHLLTISLFLTATTIQSCSTYEQRLWKLYKNAIQYCLETMGNKLNTVNNATPNTSPTSTTFSQRPTLTRQDGVDESTQSTSPYSSLVTRGNQRTIQGLRWTPEVTNRPLTG